MSAPRLVLGSLSASLLLAAMLVGCSAAPADPVVEPSPAEASETDAPAESSGDVSVDAACGVFDEATVGAAFGVTVVAEELTSFTTVDGLPKVICSWKEPDAAMDNYEVSLTVSNFAGQPTTVEEFDYLHDSSGLAVTDITGVGDAAFFASQGADWEANQAKLIWRAGNAVYDLNVLNISGLDNGTAETALQSIAQSAFS